MRAAGKHHRPAWAKAVSLLIIAVALILALYIANNWWDAPSTDDATIDADVVHVAAAVGGRIVKIPVSENSRVNAGDLLFQIDPEPFELSVRQAQSDLAFAQASVDTQRRLISSQSATAVVAGDQVRRATTNLNLTIRTVERLRPLAAKGYIPQQQLDNAETSARDAATSLTQTREQAGAAVRAIDTLATSEANVRARQAALGIAQRALADTTVRATHPGRVVGLTVRSGEMVLPNQTLFTLVTNDEWFAVGNFRETQLKSIKVGDCATAYSLIDRSTPIRSTIQGIGAGVLDTERVDLPKSVPYVEQSLNWVRVAQRFPVRVRLENPPARLMRLGASAVIEVKRGPACR